ncbi:thioredoxin family protein [Dyella jiangningensis]|uniref:Thioredoxin domain-containing protein n=1 Tax=Dyella jiangningensis TaxID=1379159 RepID=A0A328NYB2_9GAMM|nr:thioredoxin family protein [Dyella jiangningensis]RAO75138.1 hypothetical protein CA260_13610 [Dyella jiangningensis]
MKHHLPHLVLAFSALVCGAASAATAFTDIDQALKAAKAKQEPVFVDFSASWCHDCHAMDAKVLNGPEWEAEQSRFVLVRSDADSVNGVAWTKKLKVPALPSYIVLNADGSERGRLMGFIPSEKFYPELNRILSGEDAFDKLKQDAQHGSVDAAAKVLAAYGERDQAADGVRWYASLPMATRKAVSADPHAALRLAVVQMTAESRKALMSNPPLPAAESARLEKDCRTHAQEALSGPIALDEYFDTARTLLACAHSLPESERKALATARLPSLTALYDSQVPSAESGIVRDATYALAFYYKALGDSAKEQAIYQRAIAIGRKSLGDGHGGFDVKRDQAMALVLNEFLANHGSQTEDIALQKAMVAAYPDNYFYQSEYGDSLLEQGHAADALPYLQYAANNASAQDKLQVTHSLAKALIALNRRPEAEKLFDAALHTAEKQFPEMTKMQMAYWKRSGGVL